MSVSRRNFVGNSFALGLFSCLLGPETEPALAQQSASSADAPRKATSRKKPDQVRFKAQTVALAAPVEIPPSTKSVCPVT
jgi:hypothetical protein